jgi:ABC-type phosphate transport system permease subunit
MPVPKGKECSGTRQYMRVLVRAGYAQIKDDVFSLNSQPHKCQCGAVLHLTISGATCPACRDGIRSVSEDLRKDMLAFGATESESPLDRLVARVAH